MTISHKIQALVVAVLASTALIGATSVTAAMQPTAGTALSSG